MPSLKDLRTRINSVKNTQQITKTMKLVAAAKVRRARTQCEEAGPYSEKLSGVLSNLVRATGSGGPLMLTGKSAVQTVRFVIIGSDRGLCGGFNANLCRFVSEKIRAVKAEGKTIQLVCVGRKVRDALKADYGDLFIETIEGTDKKANFDAAEAFSKSLTADFHADGCDEVHLFYNRFVNMVTQEPLDVCLLPCKATSSVEEEKDASPSMDYEPSEEAILETLLPHYVSVKVLQGFLDSCASEQAARMTAMENATKNAGDMIAKLSLEYNRSRQAAITTELTEIVAGAEAL